jgi:hypothetical protein
VLTAAVGAWLARAILLALDRGDWLLQLVLAVLLLLTAPVDA